MRDTRKYGQELLQLSWPILLSQFVLLCSGLADVVMAGNHGTDALAAVGIGTSLWGTVFVTLFGVIQGLAPIIGRKFGAQELADIGAYVRAAGVLALLLSIPGMLLLSLAAESVFRLSQVPAGVLAHALDYVFIVAWALPAALLVRVFYSLTSSVKRPGPIVVVNACALLVKLPVSLVLMEGWLGLPALGLDGCAYGTLAMFCTMAALSGVYLATDTYYRKFRINCGMSPSDWHRGFRVLALGLPIGVSQLLEVGSLTIMAFIITRLGAQNTAAHQIMVSVTGLMFMSPMALGVGAQTLIANAIGRSDAAAARGVANASIQLSVLWGLGACSVLYATQSLVLRAYTTDPEVMAITHVLFPVFVIYLLFDAIQIVTASALRGYAQTLLPSVIYLLSLWGIGVFGGYSLTHGIVPMAGVALPLPALGLKGVWLAGALSLGVCAASLNALLYLRSRQA